MDCGCNAPSCQEDSQHIYRILEFIELKGFRTLPFWCPLPTHKKSISLDASTSWKNREVKWLTQSHGASWWQKTGASDNHLPESIDVDIITGCRAQHRMTSAQCQGRPLAQMLTTMWVAFPGTCIPWWAKSKCPRKNIYQGCQGSALGYRAWPLFTFSFEA